MDSHTELETLSQNEIWRYKIRGTPDWWWWARIEKMHIAACHLRHKQSLFCVVFRWSELAKKGGRRPTCNPCLPISKTLVNISHFETFSSSTELVIALQSADNNCSLCFRQKFGSIWEVLDDPEWSSSSQESDRSFKDYGNIRVNSEWAKKGRDELKIQDQAGFPPTPSIFEIAACRNCEPFSNSNKWSTYGK